MLFLEWFPKRNRAHRCLSIPWQWPAQSISRAVAQESSSLSRLYQSTAMNIKLHFTPMLIRFPPAVLWLLQLFGTTQHDLPDGSLTKGILFQIASGIFPMTTSFCSGYFWAIQFTSFKRKNTPTANAHLFFIYPLPAKNPKMQHLTAFRLYK